MDDIRVTKLNERLRSGRVNNQKLIFESGNELAAYAAKQINYHVMGYYPITPSTQIAELLDDMKAKGMHDIYMMPAEGEHSAAGMCYGASVGGGRVINATSANGLMYALEQLPVQSGTRFPMLLNVACRTISGPLSIKGDHSDIMYTLNTGWIILFANTPQQVYDFNICGLKIAEKVKLPVIVAFDGFFTSHQKRKAWVFENDDNVKEFLGQYKPEYDILDIEHPITVGSYMNEPDVMNNKYQLHLAMEQARADIAEIFNGYEKISGRHYLMTEEYKTQDSDVILFVLGSSYHTAKVAVDRLRNEGKKVGVFTISVLRPFPKEEICNICKSAEKVIVADRQDSYGAGGGNMSLEIKAAFQEHNINAKVISRVYGLGGRDFYVEDAVSLFNTAYENEVKTFDYIGVYKGNDKFKEPRYFNVISEDEATPAYLKNEPIKVNMNEATSMPMRVAPGHGACPGCGIPVNLNLLLKGIAGNVILLFQTGCAMVVTTSYPKTSFRIPYIHNLFQNGAATLSGLAEMFRIRQKRGEYPDGDITFIMVSGDGGMDIGMGSALGTAIRNEKLIIFEYDNGGYMNTGYQLSYSTPKGARTTTSHVGKNQYGKQFFNKDMPMMMAATHMPYVATVAESNPVDFIQKAAKAKKYADNVGTAYIRALSACPLNWNDVPRYERNVIGAAVNSCYFPLYEVEDGRFSINYNPEKTNKKIPISEWLGMMGRTRHLTKTEYGEILDEIQSETDKRWNMLKALAGI